MLQQPTLVTVKYAENNIDPFRTHWNVRELFYVLTSDMSISYNLRLYWLHIRVTRLDKLFKDEFKFSQNAASLLAFNMPLMFMKHIVTVWAYYARYF